MTDAVRVLLVEDDPGDVRRIQKALLGPVNAPYAVTSVELAARARETLDERDFDVVLLDLSLPDCSGVDTLVTIRQAGGAIPIVVLTGLETEGLAVQCIEAGAQDFVPKDELNSHNLERIIGYARSRAREAQIREAQIQELRANLEAFRRLSSNGVTTSITASLSGNAPLRKRDAATFQALTTEYMQVLERYMDHLVMKQTKPRETMETLVTQVGTLGAGPRDLIDIHLAGLERLASTTNPDRSRHLAAEGRLVALEMMGLLVDYYRVGVRRPRRTT